MARYLSAWALLLFAALNLPGKEKGYLVDNFDLSKKLDNWSFSNGPEFPGASGTLSLGPGHEGHGAVLAYRFTCLVAAHCGHYVAAIWKAPSPIEIQPGAALAFWVRLSPDVRLGIRITDQSGQTLQFHADAPALEYRMQGDWQPVVAPITTDPDGHWGGANNGHIQGGIAGIAILANSRYLQPVQGQVEFDEVQFVGSAEESFRLDPAAVVVRAPQGAGQLRSRLGVNIHLLKDDRALDMAKDAGFGFVRMDLLWKDLEKKGQYDFAPFDGLIRELEERGMGVLWLLDYGHPDHGGKAPQSAEDIAAYARYAAMAVSHYRGHNARFEIWNEPNLKQFLPNPASYPDLLRAALAAIRNQNPSAAVSTGGTSGVDFPFLTRVLESGSAREASAVAVHPYRESAPETMLPDLILLNNLIQRTTAMKTPVWDTEWGYPSYGYFGKNFRGDGHSDAARERQAVLAVREFLTVWALGVPVAVWYDLRDDGPDPLNAGQNFGLLNQDDSEKPAMKALRVLANLARDHTYAGLIRDVPYGAHAMRLDGAGDVVFVLWNDNAGIRPRVQLPRGTLLSLSTMFGEPVSGERGEIALDEAGGPLYVRLKR